jgi:hypothetical protein
MPGCAFALAENISMDAAISILFMTAVFVVNNEFHYSNKFTGSAYLACTAKGVIWIEYGPN